MTRRKKQLPTPTEGELAILNVLWEHGPKTVRQIHDSLRGADTTRYTTTLKQCQVMAEKGLVERDDSRKSHIYAAVIEESGTKRSLVSAVIDRVFDGSVQKMVLHALDARDITDEELEQIKQILAERGKRS